MAEPFLTRWSRLKASRPGTVQPQPAQDGPPPLPRVEDLTVDSDFRAFLRPGTPPELRRMALRRLWTLDPHFSQLDGLDEYAGDYNAPAKAVGLVATAYRIGRGIWGHEEAEDEERAGGDPPGSGQV